MKKNNKSAVYEIFKAANQDNRKTYKIWIRKANVFDESTHIEEKIIKTNDIYHEIGWIYCNTLERIDRIDYQEIKEE